MILNNEMSSIHSQREVPNKSNFEDSILHEMMDQKKSVKFAEPADHKPTNLTQRNSFKKDMSNMEFVKELIMKLYNGETDKLDEDEQMFMVCLFL